MKEMERIISRNIKNLLKEYNLNQKDLAKIAGVSESTVGKWVLEKSTPRMGAIQKIADHFGLPKSYILEEQRPTNIIPTSRRTVRIPVLGEIACGEPLYVEENFSGYKEEIADFVPNGNVFYLVAKGDSMEPTIPDGAFVLVREQPTVETGEIAAVLVNGNTEATLKRVKRQGDIVILDPDNPAYNPIIITESNPAKIIGKALKYTRDL